MFDSTRANSDSGHPFGCNVSKLGCAERTRLGIECGKSRRIDLEHFVEPIALGVNKTWLIGYFMSDLERARFTLRSCQDHYSPRMVETILRRILRIIDKTILDHTQAT